LFVLFCVFAVPQVISLAYNDGRLVKPGDLVTGVIDCGSFPAEQFLAQLVDVFPSNGSAEIVFLARSQDLNEAAPFFRRQTRVSQAYVDMTIAVSKLTLRSRASRPVNRDVRRHPMLNRPGRISWGRGRNFGLQS
jgi:hypothetical protein